MAVVPLLPSSLTVRPLLALLAALLLLPAAAANPIVATNGPLVVTDPPLPDAVDPDDMVRVMHADVDVDEGRIELGVDGLLAAHATCTAVDLTGTCSGHLCFFGPGNGELIFVELGGQGVYGVGVGLIGPSGADQEDGSSDQSGADQQGGSEADAQPEVSSGGGGEGSAVGVFVSPGGQCR